MRGSRNGLVRPGSIGETDVTSGLTVEEIARAKANSELIKWAQELFAGNNPVETEAMLGSEPSVVREDVRAALRKPLRPLSTAFKRRA